jgi:hypothetical protein
MPIMLTTWRKAWSVLGMAACAALFTPPAARASIPHYVGAPSPRVLHVSPRQTERVGKWLIRDPLGEAGGINLTAFCGNDPVNNADPLGLKKLCQKIPVYNDWTSEIHVFNKDQAGNHGYVFGHHHDFQGYVYEPYAATPENLAGAFSQGVMAELPNSLTGGLVTQLPEMSVEDILRLLEVIRDNPLDVLISSTSGQFDDAVWIADKLKELYDFARSNDPVSFASTSGEVCGRKGDAAVLAGLLGLTRKAAKNLTKEIKVRPTPGRDGATSTHIIERVDGQVNSVTHRVTKDGKVLHQHQTHIGKHGTEHRFPDEWIEYPTIPME